VVAASTAFGTMMDPFDVKDTQAFPSENFPTVPAKGSKLTPGEVNRVRQLLSCRLNNDARSEPQKELKMELLDSLLHYVGLPANDMSQMSSIQARDVDASIQQPLLTQRECLELSTPATQTSGDFSCDLGVVEDVLRFLEFPDADFEKCTTDAQKCGENCCRRERVRALLDRYAKEKVAIQEPIRKEKSLFETFMDTLAFSETSHQETRAPPSPTLAEQPEDAIFDDVVQCMAFPEQHCVEDGKRHDNGFSEIVSEGRVVVLGGHIERMQVIQRKAQLPDVFPEEGEYKDN
jgi:hypothetical protein